MPEAPSSDTTARWVEASGFRGKTIGAGRVTTYFITWRNQLRAADLRKAVLNGVSPCESDSWCPRIISLGTSQRRIIMEHKLWRSIVAVLATLIKSRKPTAFDFSDADIVKVYYWSVIHDRPTSWACERKHWPLWRRRHALPSESTMSRR